MKVKNRIVENLSIAAFDDEKFLKRKKGIKI